jgi:tetratricopeptide (TPR) repeat protein
MLEALLNDGWAYHATESERFAVELEAAAKDGVAPGLRAQFLKVSTHTIGEHLGDWRRARRLGERVLAGCSPDAETARAWAHLSIARMLAGDPVAASEAELAYLAAAGADFRPALVEARFLLVAALVGDGRAAEARGIYRAALDLARRLGDAAPHRAIGVASNNLATDLLEAPSRTEDEAALMRLAAAASHEFWLKCGTWEHDERGRYLQALAANVLGLHDEALGHIDAALAIIAANGAAPVDVTFLHLARAHALRLGGDDAAAAQALAIADAAAGAWENPGLRSWYAEERARTIGG